MTTTLSTPLNITHGYDPDLFEFRDMPFLQAMICPICTMICRDVVEANNGDSFNNTPPCCHVACKTCMLTWIHTKEQCPTCRQTLSTHQIRPAVVAARLIADAKIKCLNHSKGCQWKGEIGKDAQNIDHHMQRECPYQEIVCPHDAALVQRMDLESHVSVCPKRPVLCTVCSTLQPLDTLQEHRKSSCPNGLTSCPNGCFEHFSKIFLSNRSNLCKKQAPFRSKRKSSSYSPSSVIKKSKTDALHSDSTFLVTDISLLTDSNVQLQCVTLAVSNYSCCSFSSHSSSYFSQAQNTTSDRVLNIWSFFPRHFLSLHLKQCPMEKVYCSFQSLGCTFPCSSRILLNLHYDHSMDTHLFLSQAALENAKAELTNSDKNEFYKQVKPIHFFTGDWRQKLCVGDIVDAKDRARKWWLAKVVHIENNPLYDYFIRVNFLGWREHENEDISDMFKIDVPWCHSKGTIGSSVSISGSKIICSSSRNDKHVMLAPRSFIESRSIIDCPSV